LVLVAPTLLKLFSIRFFYRGDMSFQTNGKGHTFSARVRNPVFFDEGEV